MFIFVVTLLTIIIERLFSRLHTNLEYIQNNNNFILYYIILFVIDSPVLLKKSLFYIFSEISNFFSIIHIISFYSFNSKRIKFTYPPAIFLWMLFFGRHLYFSLLLVIRHSARTTECTLHNNGNGKESWNIEDRKNNQ